MKTLSNDAVLTPRLPWDVQRPLLESDAEASDTAKEFEGAEDLRLLALLLLSYIMSDDEPSDVDIDVYIL